MAPQRTIGRWKQTDLRRKDNIRDEVRTAGKDDCADYIENEVLDKDRWPMDVSEIAEEAGWSRQHTRQVLDDYFEPVEDEDESEDVDPMKPERHAKELNIRIPEDVENVTDYLNGVREGYSLCKQES